MLSQTGVVAVPTAIDTFTTIGTETVPAGAKSIKKVVFGIAPDVGATATSIQIAPVYRLRGSALGEQDPHIYVGPTGGHGTTTDGDVSLNDLRVEYDVDIPVTQNSTFTVEINSINEVTTAGTASYMIVYSTEDAKAKNSMADYVEAAVTGSADAWAAVATARVPQSIAGKEPMKIRAVIVGLGNDPGTSAVALRQHLRVRLTGAGLGESGNHDFLGAPASSAQQGGTPVGSIKLDRNTVRYDVDIPVKAGGDIVVEQRFDTEVPTGGTVIVGFLYN